MEKDGPITGASISMGFAMCSLDGVALDRLASRICGLDYVPYLMELPNNPRTEILKKGFERIEDISKKFKPHYLTKYQIRSSMSPIPVIDIKYAFSILRRFYRIKDKLLDSMFKTFHD